MDITIDFDGTVVKHEYPEIGEDIGALSVLRNIVQHGHRLILNTMRSGAELEAAVKWFEDRGIPLYGVNEHPEQKAWTDSPKAFSQLDIDDRGVGIPLVIPEDPDERPYVDWKKLHKILKDKRILEPRATGRTTRMIDKYVQELFENGEVVIWDHHDSEAAHRHILNGFLRRLAFEHHLNKEDLEVRKSFQRGSRVALKN